MPRRVSILLADDDPEDQALLTEQLLETNPGFQVHCVLNGKDAISWLGSRPAEDRPSLIILDFKMPVLNAAETLEKLRQMPGYEAVPKVVWSTSDHPTHKNLCAEMGAAGYFLKPVSRHDLATVAERMSAILFNGMAGKR